MTVGSKRTNALHRIYPDWEGWEEVLTRADHPHGAVKGRRFGEFVVAIHAAMADQRIRSRLAKTG